MTSNYQLMVLNKPRTRYQTIKNRESNYKTFKYWSKGSWYNQKYTNSFGRQMNKGKKLGIDKAGFKQPKSIGRGMTTPFFQVYL